LNKIRDEKLKKLAGKILEELKAQDVEIRPIHGDWISLFYHNRKLASIARRRTRLAIDIPTPEGRRMRYQIFNEEDWLKIYHEKLKKLKPAMARREP
jgi:hypothetical protein